MTTGDAVATGQPSARDLSAIAVWIACGALYAALLALIFTNPELLSGELGLVEQGQNLILVVSLVLAVDMFVRADTRNLKLWLGVVVFGLVYLLGEETSWGQHYFGWDAGGLFARINDHGETNFHNTADGWLDQKPRAILLLGMILGTIVHPLVKWARNGRGLFDKPWWLAPTLASLAPVVTSQLASLPKKIEKLHVLPYSLDFYRWSEAEELFIYAFFVTYLLSLRMRFMERKQMGITPAG